MQNTSKTVAQACHCADLAKSNEVEKSLRMVISFGGVNQKNFWSALEERLEPPMKKVHKPLEVPDSCSLSIIYRI